jgi:thioredoxin-like negative regulator of GroEL
MRAALDAPIRTTAGVLDRILAAGHPALIVFETPDCGPCQSLRPILDELAREFQHRVLIVRVTEAAEGWLAARHHLAFVPTLLLWRDGMEHARIKGNPGRVALRAHLECLLHGEPPPELAEGPRHTLQACFGAPGRTRRRPAPRALLLAGTPVAGTPAAL